MPGHFGTQPTEDGCYAESASSAHVGLFGNNTSTEPTAGGGAGGAGVFGLTVSVNAAGVFGANNGTSGAGVQGNGPDAGVSGFSQKGNALRGFSNEGDAAYAATGSSAHTGVFGNNTATAAASGGGYGGSGVFGLTVSPDSAGVLGANNGPSGSGVQGNGPTAGVSGHSAAGPGVLAHSDHGDAAQGFAHDSAGNGVHGHNDATAAAPTSGAPAGNGVFGYTDVPNASGVVGAVAASNTTGAGVTGIGPTAGRFFGDVVVTGDIQLAGADLAEEFSLVGEQPADPGTVMVILGDDHVQACDRAYDRRVAGVISGAGGYRPGLVLDRRQPGAGRHPLALTGTVWCKVDADLAPIEVGDQLTTSTTAGHAMRAGDRDAAFGAVLGKAMQAMPAGRGLIPVLVVLQ